MLLKDQSGESIELEERDVPVVVDALRDESPALEAGESAARKIESGETELAAEELEAVRTALATLPSKRN